jgi:hypothetical protein
MSKLFRNVPILTSLEMSPFEFWFLFLVVVGLARSEALRSPKFRHGQEALQAEDVRCMSISTTRLATPLTLTFELGRALLPDLLALISSI